MRRLFLLLLAIAAAGAVGCGSSSSGGSSRTGTSTQSSTAHAPSGSTSTSGSSLKVERQAEASRRPRSQIRCRAANVRLAYRNITVRPDTLRVKAGTTVRFTNYDPVSTTSPAWAGHRGSRLGTSAKAESFAVKLTKPGLVHFECTIHPATINGTIEVV